MKEFLIEKIKQKKRFIKFLFVGALNTLFGYTMFSLFITFNIHYTLATLLATIVGVMFNFKTTGSLVFKSSDNKLVFKFIGVYCVTYLINIAFLTVFKYFEVNMYLAGAILLLPIAIVSYFLMKTFVFKDK